MFVGKPELSLPSRARAAEIDLVVNARVALDPADLQKHVGDVVQTVCKSRQATPSPAKTQSFRPGRPQPTHRYSKGQ